MALVNFSGIASGIDTSGLIDAIIEQKKNSRIKPLEEAQDRDRETNDALSTIKDLLNELKDSVDTFRAVNQGALDTTAQSSNETVAIASTFGSASESTYDITVNQLARNGSISFNDRYASLDSLAAGTINDGAPAADRTLDFQIGTGASQENIAIEITSTTKISDIVESFNSQSSLATASLVNVGSQSSPSYALSITSKNSGEEKGTISLTTGAELQGSGLLSSTSLSQASNAEFSVSGISGVISRSTNTVNDVIPGVSLELDGVGVSTVSIANNPDDSASRLQDVVDKFNEVITFIQENDAVQQESQGSNTINIFGSLSNSSVDENIISTLKGVLSSASQDGLILADLGITSARDGTLDFDAEKLKEALNGNSAAVEGLLESLADELGGTSGTIAQFSRFQGVLDQTINSTEDVIRERDLKISDLEGSLQKEEDRLTGQFSRLEGLIGRLNQQASALSGLLPPA